MVELKKANTIFKWIIFAILIISLFSIFCPVYENEIRKDPLNATKVFITYFYGYDVTSYSILISLVPILAIVFLFVNFKNSQLFSFGLSVAYIINNIISVMSIYKFVEAQAESHDNFYSLSYGYYLLIIETILLGLAVILAIIFYAINVIEESKNEGFKFNGNLDELKKRLDFLTELRDNGVISDVEYEQKRNEIIKGIKIFFDKK